MEIQSVNWWHERLADWMIANPDKTMRDASKYFDCHVQTLYIIKNSDCFQQYWKQRSSEASSTLVADVKDRMLAVTEIALDNLARRLETQGSEMQTEQLVSVASMGLKSLGYTATKNAPPVVVNTTVISAELLDQARERMKLLHNIEVAPVKLLKEEATSVPSYTSDTLDLLND